MTTSRKIPPTYCKPEAVGTFASGEPVFERKHGSHLDQHPDARPLVARALEKVNAPQEGEILVTDVDLIEEIGASSCVETTPDDRIVYMMRTKADGSPARAGFTRFVLNREPEPTRMVSVIASCDRNTGSWVLITCWVGGLAAKEPWDPSCSDRDYAASCEFWSEHALCDDGTNPVCRELVAADPDAVGYFDRRVRRSK